MPVQLLEHKYVVSTGKHTSVHYHLVASTASLERWPKLSVTPENFLHRIAEFFGAKDLKVEDEKFNRAWRVKSDDENFALLVLHPDVQAWFLKMPGGVWIEIGNGAACVVASMWGTEETVLRGARLLADFWSMLPPELHAYETGVGGGPKIKQPRRTSGLVKNQDFSESLSLLWRGATSDGVPFCLSGSTCTLRPRNTTLPRATL